MAAKLRIVIADDDSLTRGVLRLLLSESKHLVVGETADGLRAVELCEQLQPNLVFLDIDMPRMTGHEAATRIKASCQKTKIIMVSALATLDNVRTAMESGANGFVVKPFNAQKVMEALQRAQTAAA